MSKVAGNFEVELARLQVMGTSRLRERYLAVFGEASRSGNREFLIKRIAWRIQSMSEGSLSERARRRAEELARESDLRTTVPRGRMASAPSPGGVTVVSAAPRGRAVPCVGSVLTRDYRGRQVRVAVLPRGFEYEGKVYRSLSAVAIAITGSHWNGRLFFGLSKEGGQ